MPFSRWMTPALLVLALGSGAATADVLKLGDGEPTVVQNADRPTRGMSAEQVEVRFGAPQAKVGPVGDPPISHWEYPDYSVYFEGRYVLHTVEHTAQAQPPAQAPRHQ